MAPTFTRKQFDLSLLEMDRRRTGDPNRERGMSDIRSRNYANVVLKPSFVYVNEIVSSNVTTFLHFFNKEFPGIMQVTEQGDILFELQETNTAANSCPTADTILWGSTRNPFLSVLCVIHFCRRALLLDHRDKRILHKQMKRQSYTNK